MKPWTAIRCAAFVASAATLTPASAWATPTITSTVVGPMIGQLAPTPNIGFYGSDLGFTMVSRDANGNKQLRIVFGDSWANNLGGSIGGIPGASDDSQGFICLESAGCPFSQSFPTGASVDAYVRTSPVHGAGSMHQGPPIAFLIGPPFNLVSPIGVYRGGASGTLLNMGPLKTPVAVFDNALSGQAHGAYGMFVRSDKLQCATGGCPSHFTCDRTLGSTNGDTSENAVPCVLGTSGCVEIPAGGFCVDTTSSVYLGTDHRIAVVQTVEVGNADPKVNSNYYCKDWNTNKFIDPATRVVDDFAPARANGSSANDFDTPDDTTTGRESVFIWGRPWFTGANGTSGIYFAYNPVPSYDPSGAFAWAPQYYTGTVDEVPQFSPDQTRAVPLVLNAPTGTIDSIDIVDQMSVSWVAPLKKWVMFYGGDVWPAYANGYGVVGQTPDGFMVARFADQPWGPWSEPEVLLDPGSHTAATGQFGPGGILFSPACTASTCAPNEPFYDTTTLALGFNPPGGPYGALYAPSIIEPWTTALTAPGTANVYWTVSTYDPYGTVLMRSTLNVGPFERRLIDTPTTFGTDPSGTWLISDQDRDGIPDLVYLRTANSTNGRVEVHVATGASQYQTHVPGLLSAFADESDGTWTMADYDEDGVPDLVFIRTANTPSGNVEVHVATAASGYTTFAIQTATVFAEESDGVWTMADYDRDGIADLVFIKTANTPSGKVEVHIASGASKYKKVTVAVVSPFGNETDGAWRMADADGDGVPDLVFVKTANTPSNYVEVHVAPGSGRFAHATTQTATDFINETDGTWTMADYDKDGAGDLVFIRLPASGASEVHVVSGN